MGIYSSTRYEHSLNGAVLTEVYDAGYGMKVTRVWQLIVEIEDRETCYCCSCGEHPGHDPYCRNHGFAGTRKCEKHEMPGDEFECNWDTEEPNPNRPLLSVQAERARGEEAASHW